MSNSDFLTMGELDGIAVRASRELGFPLEVTNTGGGIWLVIGRVPSDPLLEVVIGDGDTDTKYGWSVNRVDERGDHMDALDEGAANTLRKALCGIRNAIRLNDAERLGFDTFAPVRPPESMVELEAWYAFMANHSDIPHPDDSPEGMLWGTSDLVTLFQSGENRYRYDLARRAAHALHPDPSLLALSIDLV